MALYIKHRPKDFTEIISNKGTVLSLEAELKKEDHSHSYLFIGPSGCGKTTIARIFANKLGCHEKSIIEIDAGSERGVETADNLRESILYTPIYGSIKVYIIDEIQATSAKFQEALLKTLEDTPKHIYFILCTTDPQKIKKTVKTRCSTYEVSALNNINIYKLLSKICKKENIQIQDDVLKEIAIVSEGCPRQALVILDQVILVEPSYRLKIVKSSKIEKEEIKKLIKLLLTNSNWKDVAKVLKGLKEDPEKIRMSILMYCNAILLNGKSNPKIALIMDYFKDPFYSAGKALLTLACYNIISE